MSRGQRSEAVEEVKQRCDLVDLVGGYLKLEKRGRNYVGLCPFHQEKTPSFNVSPDKQFYHCFGCGASGDVFSFIMNIENTSFAETLKMLAGKCGVVLPEEKKTVPEAEQARHNLQALNNLAAKYYHYVLNSTPAGAGALNYLSKRGINASSVETYKLGFAPPQWDALLKAAMNRGYKAEFLVKGGLAVPRNDGRGHYDRFRSRIMFPITNRDGQVTGFGGRAFGEDNRGPKYLNSPATPLFDKKNVLYGIYQARNEIRAQKAAVIMEGYTDVIMAYQAGIKNAVASLGTALTPQQARQLRMQAPEVLIAYDADTAGEAAAERGLSILNAMGCRVKVARLPGGEDPDTYLREYGREAFDELLSRAETLVKYRLNNLKKKYNMKEEAGRIPYIRGSLSIINELEDALEKEDCLRQLAEETKMPEGVLRAEIRKIGQKNRKTRDYGNNLQEIGQTNSIQGDIPVEAAEKVILSVLFANAGVFDVLVEKVKGEDILSPYTKKVLQACGKLRDEGREISVNGLAEILTDEGEEFLSPLRRLVAVTAIGGVWDELPGEEIPRIIDDCYRRLALGRLQETRREIENKIKEMEIKEMEKEKSGEKREAIKVLLARWESLKMAEQEIGRSGRKEG